MNKIYFLFLAIYLFVACTPQPNSKTQVKPYWLINQNSLESSYAVGSAVVNFQGVYMQRNEAINKAKAELAHSIESFISSVYKNSSYVNKVKNDFNSIEKIKALSNTFLNNTYQIDAYFDEDRKLYVLVKNSTSEVNLELKPLTKQKFNNENIMNSRCYSQKILSSIKTKSKMHKGRPIWFYRPNETQKLASIGIAEKEEEISFFEQKRVAYSLAKASLSKRQRTKMRSEDEILSILSGEISGGIFESSSIVRTATKIRPSHIEDIWLDSTSCELYLYLLVN